MRITQEADYAIRIVGVLIKKGSILSAREIAEAAGVTPRFTLKILRKLSENGIVTSQKGAHGGYKIALESCDIPLGQIIECIDGPMQLVSCMNSDYSCSHPADSDGCNIRHYLFDLTKMLREEVYSVTMDKFL